MVSAFIVGYLGNTYDIFWFTSLLFTVLKKQNFSTEKVWGSTPTITSFLPVYRARIVLLIEHFSKFHIGELHDIKYGTSDQKIQKSVFLA